MPFSEVSTVDFTLISKFNYLIVTKYDIYGKIEIRKMRVEIVEEFCLRARECAIICKLQKKKPTIKNNSKADNWQAIGGEENKHKICSSFNPTK